VWDGVSVWHSGWRKDKGETRFQQPPGIAALIPNFVDFGCIKNAVAGLKREDVLSDMGISSDSKVISMTGRLIPTKRFDKFIRILAECAQKTDEKVVGVIMGDGPERQELEELVVSLNQKNLKIVFLGYQKNIFKNLFASDLFLFPSKHEVLPLCLIEASALGVPIVCSNIPGNNDIVENGANGFLIDLEPDYTESVLKILNDQKLAMKLASNGIERTKRLFGREAVLKNIVDVYKEVCAF
jgi:glycosyltransferase involved in cell wall biosynthesis